jgi:hypothetical protein
MTRILTVWFLITSPVVARASGEEVHRRAFLGVGLVELTPGLRAHFGAPKDAGVMVGAVDEDGPAAHAGVRIADILTTIDGVKLEDPADLRERVRDHKEGERVRVELVRDGKSQTVEVKLAEREVKELDAWELFRMPTVRWRGDVSKAMQKAVDRVHALQGEWPKMERDLEEKMKALDERMEKLEKRLERGGETGRGGA